MPPSKAKWPRRAQRVAKNLGSQVPTIKRRWHTARLSLREMLEAR